MWLRNWAHISIYRCCTKCPNNFYQPLCIQSTIWGVTSAIWSVTPPTWSVTSAIWGLINICHLKSNTCHLKCNTCHLERKICHLKQRLPSEQHQEREDRCRHLLDSGQTADPCNVTCAPSLFLPPTELYTQQSSAVTSQPRVLLNKTNLTATTTMTLTKTPWQ